MSNYKNHPLITFAIFAYNQEKFIREAIEGAFSQTYSPLEIILSDDHSSDHTFEIMKGMASNYCGPHKIILNRNKQNIGIGGHVNHVMAISNGDPVVGAAGDDISLPQRTEKVYYAWQKSNRKAFSIYSSVVEIDEEGKHIKVICASVPKEIRNLSYMATNLCYNVIGCSHCWSKKIFDIFGLLPTNIIYEDRLIAFRSLLLGQHCAVSEPLVLYRRHTSNVSFSTRKDNFVSFKKHHQVRLCERLNILRYYLLDLGNINVNITNKDVLKKAIVNKIKILNYEIILMNSDFVKRLIIFRDIRQNTNIKCKTLFLLFLKNIFPKLYFAYYYVRNTIYRSY